MAPKKPETAAEREEHEKRDKEARDVTNQIKAGRRSQSRDVNLKDRGSSGTGRTISNLLGLGGLFPLGSGDNAITDVPAGTTHEGHQMRVYERHGLKITFSCRKEADGSSNITVTFSNSLDEPMTNFLFEVAVPKAFRLVMQPITGRVLLPNNNSLSQAMSVVRESHCEKGLAMKLRISYLYKGQTVEETGQVENFPPGY